MSRMKSAKAATADGVNRALALALRSPVAAASILQRGAASSSATRHGQQAEASPLTRSGKPTN